MKIHTHVFLLAIASRACSLTYSMELPNKLYEQHAKKYLHEIIDTPCEKPASQETVLGFLERNINTANEALRADIRAPEREYKELDPATAYHFTYALLPTHASARTWLYFTEHVQELLAGVLKDRPAADEREVKKMRFEQSKLLALATKKVIEDNPTEFFEEES